MHGWMYVCVRVYYGTSYRGLSFCRKCQSGFLSVRLQEIVGNLIQYDRFGFVIFVLVWYIIFFFYQKMLTVKVWLQDNFMIAFLKFKILLSNKPIEQFLQVVTQQPNNFIKHDQFSKAQVSFVVRLAEKTFFQSFLKNTLRKMLRGVALLQMHDIFVGEYLIWVKILYLFLILRKNLLNYCDYQAAYSQQTLRKQRRCLMNLEFWKTFARFINE
eukprot:TRINITY_DN3789_c0_g1_i1.p1 TRINITY_DN3789_c0_g1~~TRINITY_DN3789_c0_g1_i1.p1  ORF type:complete len:214 (-),score=-0.35 TRINITY_DN3789_c0_g1_i1:63-704(-)